MKPHPRHGLVAFSLAASLSLLAGCGSDGPTNVADPVDSSSPATTSGTSTSAAPTTSVPVTTAPPTSTSGAPSPTTAPIYFVGDTPSGHRLYSELRSVSGSSSLEAATALLVKGDTLDPDYRTLLPSGMNVISVTLSDGKILVEVSADSQIAADKSMSPADAKLAVQQLVYTLQAVSGTKDPVQVVQSDGAAEVPVPLLGVDTTNGVKAAKPLKVLALVNVTSPAEGATVSGTFTAHGLASSFEANVPWSLHQGGADGKVVKQGYTTAAGYLDKLYPFSTEVSVAGLAPGDYTFVASTDASGGEGPKPTQDTKAITVG